MKRFLSILLAVLLLCSATSALATVKFTTSSYSGIVEGEAAYNDEVYKLMQEMFDFEMETYQLTWDTGAEKNRMWIASGTMPDYTFWADFNYDEYMTYVDQGLIKALPDGWEETYPNLADAVKATGIGDLIKVDGKTYALPKVIHYVFSPLTTAIAPHVVYYRTDWAEQLGIEFGKTCTLEELLTFIRKAKEMDPVGNGETIGLTTEKSKFQNYLMQLNNPSYNKFVKVDGQYVWGPTMEGTAAPLTVAQQIYAEGLLDPDFYLKDDDQAINTFAAGQAAALIYTTQVDHVRKVIQYVEEASTEPIDGWDRVGVTLLTNDDGKWAGRAQTNYWAASLFSPACPDETMETILKIFDFLCTTEGQELVNLGIKGKDFDVDADGNYVILREANEDGSYENILNIYPSCNLWYTGIVLVDSFAFVNPTFDIRTRQASIDMYETAFAGNVVPYESAEIDFYSSDLKAQYSVDIANYMLQIVLDPSTDAQAAWDAMIEENRAMWEPLLNEYNEKFGA